jgi:endonuclease YncB( thermonuclease family)
MRSRRAVLTFFAIVALVLGACPPAPRVEAAVTVVHVQDGDSLIVSRGGEEVTVRLEGIDAPERYQPFSNVARQHLTSLAEGREVTLEEVETDRYGRIVARVRLGERDLSEEMVRAGLAWHYTFHSSDRTLARLEREAREAGRGLWRDREPVPPWDWRRQRR